jgi:glycosyltransferase involved in cell wall biosynthesis
MRVAFYAPMKPPTSQRPSGDRLMARLIMAALKHAGHDVSLVSKFRSWNRNGDPKQQDLLEKRAQTVIKRVSRDGLADFPGHKPDIWLTYHLYYKAPDLIGPHLSRFFGIPYLVAEASHAPKREYGPWARGHSAAEQAIRFADHIISLNPADAPCITPLLKKTAKITPLRPFLPNKWSFSDQTSANDGLRFLTQNGLDPSVTTLAVVAMMRDGDKYASYCALAEALDHLSDLAWQLVIIGDGPMRQALERRYASLGERRIKFLGALREDEVATALKSSDLFVWPAINEAYGMAILEAQATGLPVVAGDSGGVGQIIRNGKTGILTQEGNIKDFADAARSLLIEPGRRSAMGEAAKQVVKRDHSFEKAATTLDSILIESKKGKTR